MGENIQLPKRKLRPCGHPEDWTLDLKMLDDVIESYCLGCLVQSLGLKPVARHRIVVDREHPNGYLVKLETLK